MTEWKPPPYGVQVYSTVKRVTTQRGIVQSHRGFAVRIAFRGYPKPYYTLTFHQKRKATAYGERVAKRIMREGGPEALGERAWMTPTEVRKEQDALLRRRDAEFDARMAEIRRVANADRVSRQD